MPWFYIYSYGQYGNYKYTNYGTKSLLLTGNVTGSVEDLGLTYYNPARLSQIENNGLSINAQAYEYQDVTLENAFSRESSLNDARFNSLPSMAAGTFTLFNTRFAYSYFRTDAPTLDLNYRSEILANDDNSSSFGDDRFFFDMRYSARTRSQLYGLAWAFNINEHMSVGVSLFGAYYENDTENNMEYAIQEDIGAVVFSQNRQSIRQKSYGILGKVGVSYELSWADLGLNVNLPYMELFGNGRYTYNEVLAGLSAEEDGIYDFGYRMLPSRLRSPLGVSIGAGIPVGPHKLHLNIDYVSPLGKYQRVDIPEIDLGGEVPTEVTWQEERVAVFNVGMGAEILLSDTVMLYSGFSTDSNSLSTNANALKVGGNSVFRAGTGADFFHVGLGTGLTFDWANLTLGATYSRGTSLVPAQTSARNDLLPDPSSTAVTIAVRRWQFIIGLDIPFLETKVGDIMK